MKKNYFLLLILFLIVGNQLVHAQCTVKIIGDTTIVCGGTAQLHVDPVFNASGTDPVSGVGALFFVNSDTGFAAGDGICKTMDGGQTWTLKVLGGENYKTIFFTNAQIGYAAASNGKVIKTIDAGNTWIPVDTLPVTDVYNFDFVTDSIGFIAVSKGAIYKTIDAGKTWIKKTTNPANEVRGIHFPDVNTGFTVDDKGNVFKSIDGGNTWSLLIKLPVYLQSVFFINNNVGFVGGGLALYKTTDGGLTWKLCPGFDQNIALRIQFVDANTGYVSGRFKLFKTTDGGTTWRSQNFDYMRMEALHFPNAKTGYVGGGHETFVGKKVVKLTLPDAVTWAPITANSADIVVNPKQTTTYKVTAVTKGCYAYDSIKVVVNPFEVHAGLNKTVTCGGSIELNEVSTNYTGTGILSYSWSPATGLSNPAIQNPVATPNKTTTYYLTVTTPNGCTATDSVTILVNPLTAYSYGTTNPLSIICGSSVKFNGIATNYTGSGTLTYLWSPAAGLDNPTLEIPTTSATKNTTYHVVVTTPNGCEARDSTVKLVVTPLQIFSSSGDVSLVCDGNAQFAGSYTNYNGLGVLTYTWSPSTGLDNATIQKPTASVTKNTTYHLLIKTDNGCEVNDSVKVTVIPLTANAGTDKTYVCGGTSQFDNVISNYTGTGTLSYSWSPSTGLDNTTIERPTASITKNTTYHVLVKTANGCEANDSVDVIVNPLTADAGGDKVHVCGGISQFDNVISNYTGTGTLTYSWLPTTGLNNAAILNPTSTASGITYTVNVTTPNGCKASDQVRADLVSMNAPEICMVGVDSTGKNVIRWNNLSSGAIDSVFIYKETTVAGNFVKIGSTSANKNGYKDITSQPEIKSSKYKISFLDTCGLESAKSSFHKTMHLAITKGVGTSWNLIWESYEGFALPVPTYNIYRGTDAFNLQFLDATSGTSNQYTNYNPPPGDLFYAVEVVNPNPCDPSNAAKTLRSNVASSKYVGIFEQGKNTFSFSAYPNPASDQLTVEFENVITKDITLTIYNSIGSIVKAILIQQNKQQIDVSELSNGFYMIELKSADGHAMQKLTIEK